MNALSFKPRYSYIVLDVTIRLAALISIRKELLQMGVALVCIAHDAHSEQSEGADRMHTAAALCQALCCQDTLVVTSCSGNRADSQHDSSESTWGQQSGHRHCKRSVIVTDACDVPVRRLVCEQIAEGPGKSSMVISIDSSDLPKEYVEQCSAREDGIMEVSIPCR